MASANETIRRLRFVYTSEGADKVASDLNKVAEAGLSPEGQERGG